MNLSEIRTPYVRFFATAIKFLVSQLTGAYGDRWRVRIDAAGGQEWRIVFTHWDEAGLESKESFGVTTRNERLEAEHGQQPTD